MSKKALVLSSGGLDSTVCLADTIERVGRDNVIALNMFYNQKHSKEISCCRSVCEHMGVTLITKDLSSAFTGSRCSLVCSDENVPECSYDEQMKKGFVTTEVPFRNGLFLSFACAIARSQFGMDEEIEIVLGNHLNDYENNAYPDCSLEFIQYMNGALQSGTRGKVCIVSPFCRKTKADIVKRGIELNVPFEKTWSCYLGGEHPCGKCGTCLERIEAFRANGINE